MRSMARMKPEYLEKIYAGWLGKIIGIRVGAPVEGWTYDAIQNVYGTLDGYPINYSLLFAADDDSNGPMFLIRALEDTVGEFNAQSVGEALLNYIPYEHGFFWWGGYGVSTEHTAYLNLRHGIQAPRSGSIEQNGSVVAEQIGGQIFIDTWGLVTPGNPDLAAEYAAKAASVSHDRNGIYGGVFIAVCISYAFEEQDIGKMIQKGLSYIPEDSEYTRMARSVVAYHAEHPGDWKDCFSFIQSNFGYDRYGGSCHIIPNAALIILALLYGSGDFKKSLDICNMCGWDTDCNLGNLASILGVRGGLAEVDRSGLRGAIRDFFVCSSVVGSLNIQDIPYSALYLAKLAWKLAGEELSGIWADLAKERIDSCHFEYPGSTHAICARTEKVSGQPEIVLSNTDEAAYTGQRSLKAVLNSALPRERFFLYKKTYYRPSDFHNSRYDPSFSPLLYPGQTVRGSIYVPEYGCLCKARLYVHDACQEARIEGEAVSLQPGKWYELKLSLPYLDGGLIDEAGFIVDVCGDFRDPCPAVCMIDDFVFEGHADYRIDCSKLKPEKWSAKRVEIEQFTRLKGLLRLENQELHLSCTDFGEAYTGRHDWTDYTAEFAIRPVIGRCHMVNVRVQGAIRSYAVALLDGNVVLLKNKNGSRQLASAPFFWKANERYTLTVEAHGAELSVAVDGKRLFSYTDTQAPYLSGGIGISVRDGSHCAYSSISIS